jgi:single-strand DNA-binding protein
MLNRVVLVGRLARDPFELRRSQTTSNAVISFTIAVDSRFNRQQEEGRSNADFFTVVAFSRQAEFVEQYLRKGMLVGVEGRLQSRSYEDRNGNRVNTVEVAADNIQILESKSAREERESNDFREEKPVKSEPQNSGIDIDDDDLPF